MRVFALKLPTEYPSLSVIEALHAAVDADTSARVKRFRLREDALRCLSGRLLLVWYLRIVLELNDAIKVERTDKGRPYLVSPELEIDFNLSHDGDLVLLAVSHQKSARVGIDVTRIQSVDDARELEEALEDQLHPLEKSALCVLPPCQRAEQLAVIWALKEAYTKALGVGLGYDFSTLHVSDTLVIKGWHFTQGKLDGSVWAAATDEKGGMGGLQVEAVSWDQLIASVRPWP